jgi:hypothetical protein
VKELFRASTSVRWEVRLSYTRVLLRIVHVLGTKLTGHPNLVGLAFAIFRPIGTIFVPILTLGIVVVVGRLAVVVWVPTFLLFVGFSVVVVFALLTGFGTVPVHIDGVLLAFSQASPDGTAFVEINAVYSDGFLMNVPTGYRAVFFHVLGVPHALAFFFPHGTTRVLIARGAVGGTFLREHRVANDGEPDQHAAS